MSSEPLAPYVVLDGRLAPWDQGPMHAFSPAVKDGAGAFAGLRGHWNETRKVMGFAPVVDIGGRPAGGGKIGALTRRPRAGALASAEGASPDHADWRLPLGAAARSAAAE